MILTMSFPYQYVENYGTPTTPHASPWECDNTADMFIQEQVPQPIQQQAYEPPQTIQLEEQPLPEPDRIVPSQGHRELHSSAVRLYPMHEARPEGDGGEHQPRSPLVDTSPSGNGSGSGSTTMPIRHAPTTRPHLQLATHPYRRSQSASGGSGGRAPRERQHVRFASTGGGGAAGSTSHPMTMLPSYPPGPSSTQTARCARSACHQCFFCCLDRHNGILILAQSAGDESASSQRARARDDARRGGSHCKI